MARPTDPPLGPTIRHRRQQLGLTQADLASTARIADETVSRIERGRLSPSLKIAERIAIALKMPLADLRGGKRIKTPGIRPCDARLLAVVRDLDDTSVDDLVRAIKVMLAVGSKRATK
jgi:transcriptional regulator with XRE-family HTH domain